MAGAKEPGPHWKGDVPTLQGLPRQRRLQGAFARIGTLPGCRVPVVGIGVETTTLPAPPSPVEAHAARHLGLQAQARPGGPITPAMADACVWDDAMVAASSAPTRDVAFVTIGGGMGSFAVADMLRIAGAPASDIEVIGPFKEPYGCLKLLLDNSQVPEGERIRSGSSDRMDNVWGWPGYSLEEAVAEHNPAGIWHSVTEPVLSEYMTPRGTQVYRAVDREAARISWADMFTVGRVPFIRKRREGGYFVVVVPPGDATLAAAEIRRARYVHLSVGFSAAHALEDLANYSDPSAGPPHAVNVYEPHEHVYQALAGTPGSLLLRGAASSSLQVIQRVARDRRERGAQTELYQLFRNYVPHSAGRPWWRLPGGGGFSYQAFTFAKGSYGGQLQRRYRSLTSDEERARFVTTLANTAVPPRSLWKRDISRARKEGWYHVIQGSAGGLTPLPDGRVRATIACDDGSTQTLDVDYVVDATGAEHATFDHEILTDLVTCSGAEINAIEKLAINPAFEVGGTRNTFSDGSGGRLYATGVAVLGNPYVVPMYSFWALQYSAWKTSEDLARQGFCAHMGPVRSTTGWLRRMSHRPPRSLR